MAVYDNLVWRLLLGFSQTKWEKTNADPKANIKMGSTKMLTSKSIH